MDGVYFNRGHVDWLESQTSLSTVWYSEEEGACPTPTSTPPTTSLGERRGEEVIARVLWESSDDRCRRVDVDVDGWTTNDSFRDDASIALRERRLARSVLARRTKKKTTAQNQEKR